MNKVSNLDTPSRHFNSTHGLSNHPLWSIWRGMRRRCSYLKDKEYKNYGGRGIVVCAEWEKEFLNFYNWSISNGWDNGLKLDRRNNNGNYEPNNCRWATNKQQARNTRRNVWVEYKGESKVLAEWSEILNMNQYTLYDRYEKGERGEVLFRPININKRRQFKNK